MSTANRVPETWKLTGDDAKDTLVHTGRTRLVKDALKRLRYSDGFSHARSMAFLGILLFIEGAIAAIGLSHAFGSLRLAKSLSDSLQSVVPGPAGRILVEAARQGQHAASSGYWLAIAFGTIAAIVTGATMMGQIERAMNRLYGIESDRDTLHKYSHALLLAFTVGILSVVALGVLGLGGVLVTSTGNGAAHIAWSILRWPLGIALLVGAIALLFRWAPRRHQPAWSWMSFGAAVAVVLLVLVVIALNVFFSLSSTFGATYGPLAGIVALALWAYLSAIALLIGAAIAAQLEAVRAGAGSTRDVSRIDQSGQPSTGERDERPVLRRVS